MSFLLALCAGLVSGGGVIWPAMSAKPKALTHIFLQFFRIGEVRAVSMCIVPWV